MGAFANNPAILFKSNFVAMTPNVPNTKTLQDELTASARLSIFSNPFRCTGGKIDVERC